MSKCPVEECKDMEDLKHELYHEPHGLKPRVMSLEGCVRSMKNSKISPRVYIGSIVTVAIIVISTFLVMWADTRGLASDRKDAKERKEKLIRLEEKYTSLERDIREIKAKQDKAADNTEIIKRILREMQKDN